MPGSRWVEIAVQVAVLASALGGVGWVCWQIEQAEQDEKRNGFEKGAGEELRARVQAKRRRPEWERRAMALWRRGEAVRLQQEKQG